MDPNRGSSEAKDSTDKLYDPSDLTRTGNIDTYEEEIPQQSQTGTSTSNTEDSDSENEVYKIVPEDNELSFDEETYSKRSDQEESNPTPEFPPTYLNEVQDRNIQTELETIRSALNALNSDEFTQQTLSSDALHTLRINAIRAVMASADVATSEIQDALNNCQNLQQSVFLSTLLQKLPTFPDNTLLDLSSSELEKIVEKESQEIFAATQLGEIKAYFKEALSLKASFEKIQTESLSDADREEKCAGIDDSYSEYETMMADCFDKYCAIQEQQNPGLPEMVEEPIWRTLVEATCESINEFVEQYVAAVHDIMKEDGIAERDVQAWISLRVYDPESPFQDEKDNITTKFINLIKEPENRSNLLNTMGRAFVDSAVELVAVAVEKQNTQHNAQKDWDAPSQTTTPILPLHTVSGQSLPPRPLTPVAGKSPRHGSPEAANDEEIDPKNRERSQSAPVLTLV